MTALKTSAYAIVLAATLAVSGAPRQGYGDEEVAAQRRHAGHVLELLQKSHALDHSTTRHLSRKMNWTI